MRRISLFYYPIFFLLFLTFSSCSFFLHSKSNGESKEEKVPAVNYLLLPEDEVSQPLEDFPIPLSKHYFWGKEDCSYDKETKILRINGSWEGMVLSAQDFSGSKTFDASDYRYIKIEYSPVNSGSESNLPFRLRCDYEDGTSEYQLCERKRTVQYLRLNSEKKSKINKIVIWTSSEFPIEYKINSLCFSQSRHLNPIVDYGNKIFNDSISAINLVKQMGFGWNLGNTFDAHSFHWQPDYWTLGMETEFHWSKIETTPELLSFPKSQGYKTIRIPVTWFTHIVDDKYTIDPDWMRRVKQVVDWAIDAGYYVILNEHHSVHGDQETTYKTDKVNEFESRRMNSPLKYADGYIVSTNPDDIAESKRFLSKIWTQIATAFNNGYDEHLIFETMNEPRNPRDYHIPGESAHEWNPGLKLSWLKFVDGKEVIGGYWCNNLNCQLCLSEYEVLNEYNQVCLDAIRATGGNNAKRFVMIPGMGTGIVPALNKIEDAELDIFSPGKFKMPTDTATDKLILTVHKYPQWKEIEGNIFFRESTKESITNQFVQLNQDFIQRGIPVVIGETGALKSDAPLEERIKCFSHLFIEAKKYGMSVIWWDCGDYAQINRKNLEFYEPALTETLLDIYNQE